jgi:hypothetical protein
MKPIPVVVDVPTPEPGLGFVEYAAALSAAIRGGEPPQFTVGLYGSWGTGKSTLLGAVFRDLAQYEDTIAVHFDAWRHERAEHIVVPLLHAVHQAVTATGDATLVSHLRRALESLVFSLNFKLAFVGVDASKARERWEDQGLPQLDSAFAEPFAALQRIPEALDGRRIVILIDDLDRCSPEKVVSVLEAINVVMDVRGLIFVLALDYDVLTEAVRVRYPHIAQPHVFVEKMVQLPFRVPPPDVRGATFLSELVPQLAETLDDRRDVADSITDIADIGLQRNPRQLKRLVNAFLLTQRIAELRKVSADDHLLLALLGLQLRWPDRYRSLYASILAGDGPPFPALSTDQDPEFARYVERFFAGRDGLAEDLRRVVEYTTALAIDVGPEADPWEAGL